METQMRHEAAPDDVFAVARTSYFVASAEMALRTCSAVTLSKGSMLVASHHFWKPNRSSSTLEPAGVCSPAMTVTCFVLCRHLAP